MSPTDDGDDLAARLRGVDPAASLPPATSERVARLLEDAMSEDLSNEHPTSTEKGAPGAGRGRLGWLAAAVAVVVVGGLAVLTLGGGDDPAGPSADSPEVIEPTVTELAAPDEATYNARCMVPNAETLSGTATAFDGTVLAIEDDVVTLEPTTWYAGDPTDLVEVTAPGEELERLLVAVSFEVGERYLVAADEEGQVMVCGFSEVWSEDLEEIYVDAFAS